MNSCKTLGIYFLGECGWGEKKAGGQMFVPPKQSSRNRRRYVCFRACMLHRRTLPCSLLRPRSGQKQKEARTSNGACCRVSFVGPRAAPRAVHCNSKSPTFRTLHPRRPSTKIRVSPMSSLSFRRPDTSTRSIQVTQRSRRRGRPTSMYSMVINSDRPCRSPPPSSS